MRSTGARSRSRRGKGPLDRDDIVERHRPYPERRARTHLATQGGRCDRGPLPARPFFADSVRGSSGEANSRHRADGWSSRDAAPGRGGSPAAWFDPGTALHPASSGGNGRRHGLCAAAWGRVPEEARPCARGTWPWVPSSASAGRSGAGGATAAAAAGRDRGPARDPQGPGAPRAAPPTGRRTLGPHRHPQPPRSARHPLRDEKRKVRALDDPGDMAGRSPTLIPIGKQNILIVQ